MNNLFKPILLSAIVLLDINNEGQCMEDAFIMNNAFIGEKIDPNKTNDISNTNSIIQPYNNVNDSIFNTTQTVVVNNNQIETFKKPSEIKESKAEMQQMSLKESCEKGDKELLKKYNELHENIVQINNKLKERKDAYDKLNPTLYSDLNNEEWVQYFTNNSKITLYPQSFFIQNLSNELGITKQDSECQLELEKFIQPVKEKLVNLYINII